MKTAVKFVALTFVVCAMSVATIGCGPKAVTPDAEPNNGVSNEDYSQMMNEGNEAAKQNQTPGQ